MSIKCSEKEIFNISDFKINELNKKAREIRAYTITAISAANSGHTGGSMSIIDILTALYFHELKYNPKNPDWEDRDRLFLSAGHKAPALYSTLGLAGFFDINEVVKLRRFGSGFEGHPNRFKVPGIEASTGSLGQGLGIAIGSALNAKYENKKYRVFCIMGDGELDEGSVWEAAMSAAHYKLDNLIAIIDRNNLQIDGLTCEVMEIEPLREKWEAFGWKVFFCDGHDIHDIVTKLHYAYEVKDKPIVIIADTIKGKGISFAENNYRYHGIAPKDGLEGKESLKEALANINCDSFSIEKAKELLGNVCQYQNKVNDLVEKNIPKFSTDYFWNKSDKMKVEMFPNRSGFGKGLDFIGEDKRVVVLGADITESIKMNSFYQEHKERKSRFFSFGIAEQNITTVAAGLAKEGKIPFIGSYGVFIAGRNWDQIRTTICYNNYNVKIIDAHGGISVGPDGGTHQALEDISNLYYLPNMKILVPADSIEAEKSTIIMKNINGPVAMRLAREATPLVTSYETPFEFGKANIIRYRGIQDNFIDAFDYKLSCDYFSENEDLAIIASGPVLTEAMRAAYILKEEYNIETRIINNHTIKPIDEDAIIKAVNEIGKIITIEEHQVGGIGNIIAGLVAKNQIVKEPYKFQMIGVKDRFGESGQPWELMNIFGLTAEFIAKSSKDFLNL
ncbi:MAG: transketolase [Actinomycetota bacterium]|nr:transketolase [Actinomycetota bacterium]